MAPSTEPPADGIEESLIDDLERLAALRDRGLLTEEEFARAKSRALQKGRVDSTQPTRPSDEPVAPGAAERPASPLTETAPRPKSKRLPTARWYYAAIVIVALIVLGAIGAFAAGHGGEKESARSKDPEGFTCADSEKEYGRCPYNPFFGKTDEQVRAKIAETKKATKARALGNKKRHDAGWNDYSTEIWWKWDNSVCTGRYVSCWGMLVTADSGCDALTVTIKRFINAESSVARTTASAYRIAPGGVAELQFKARKGGTASLETIDCATSSSGVQFEVTGSAPNGVDITYGDDTSSHQGSRRPPFYKVLPLRSDALYYALTAQLQGGGRITCKLTIGYSVVVGHASGGYNICSAQLNSDLTGGWSK